MSSEQEAAGKQSDDVAKTDIRSAMLDANTGLKNDQIDYAESRLAFALGQLRKYKAQEARR